MHDGGGLMNSSEMRTMLTPYLTLEAKRHNNSKPYLMLSELIDNSIGSWQQMTTIHDLKVSLLIDTPGRIISCTDNAGGMSASELLDSVELNKEKMGNVINMFGVGMKNAAFWFGQDLTIKTHNGIEGNSTSVFLSNKTPEQLKSPIQWWIDKTQKARPSQGTDVIIGNIYEDKLLTNKEMEETISILETKYRNFLLGIERGKVEIEIIHIRKDGITVPYMLEGHSIRAQVIPDDKIDDFISSIERRFVAPEIQLKGLRDLAIQKARNHQPLEFEFDVHFGFFNKIKFTLGIQNQARTAGRDKEHFSKNFGITAYQSGRAIRISPINPIEFPQQDYTRTNIKRVYGFCELGHIFRPDNNKADFNFGQHKESFYKIMENIGKDLIRLADSVFDAVASKVRVDAGNSSANSKKIKGAVAAKTTDRLSIASVKGSISEWYFKDADSNSWKVFLEEISVDSTTDKNFFINAVLEEKFQISVTYNVNHPIWKPLVNDGNPIDLKTVTYPLIVIMGLTKIGMQNHLLHEWLGGEKDDYLDVINALSLAGLKL